MEYKSPLEAILERSGELDWHYINSRFQIYCGVLDQILIDLASLPLVENMDFDSYVTSVLHPSRIIRKVLDSKVDDSRLKNEVDVVNAATSLALRAYSDFNSINKGIKDFKEVLSGTKNLFLLHQNITQEDDGTTWESSDPEYCRDSSTFLLDSFLGKDILFIPLAHGGVFAGLDIFLRYVHLSGNNNSVCYPVRFSANKLKDKQPMLSKSEIMYLMEKSDARPVILFDEDCYTGRTIEQAINFFNTKVFNGKDICVRINMDMGGELCLD